MLTSSRFALALFAAAAMFAGPCEASPFGRHQKPQPAAVDAGLIEIQRALDEQRYVDAGRMLDAAALSGASDTRLSILTGELDLARGRYADALNEFGRTLDDARTRADALQGQGIALSQMGRSDEALATLKKAVAENPSAWRAWNALGVEFDQRRDWVDAEDAYGRAITASKGAAVALNNRGYSRLLQSRPDDAVADLVAALQKKPDLAEARTNLRLALAMKGDYGRAIAPAATDDKASLLNNAGFAAALRGDYAQAETLLDQAMNARSQFYGRASENLGVVRSLAARDKAGANASP
jgi:Flp pilus assembly protein TadD